MGSYQRYYQYDGAFFFYQTVTKTCNLGLLLIVFVEGSVTGEGREDRLEDEGGWSSESVFEITNTFQISNIDDFKRIFIIIF